MEGGKNQIGIYLSRKKGKKERVEEKSRLKGILFKRIIRV